MKTKNKTKTVLLFSKPSKETMHIKPLAWGGVRVCFPSGKRKTYENMLSFAKDNEWVLSQF